MRAEVTKAVEVQSPPAGGKGFREKVILELSLRVGYTRWGQREGW